MVLFLGRTTYPGSSQERLLPLATRPHTDVGLTPPITFSGEDLVDDDDRYLKRWQNSLASDSFKSLTGSRLSLMPFTESRYVESASGFHITGKLQCLRWMPTAEFPGIPLLLQLRKAHVLPKTLSLESGCAHTHTHTPRTRGDQSFHAGQSEVWSSSSSSKRKGEQAREEDDSSADRRPEGGKRGGESERRRQ